MLSYSIAGKVWWITNFLDYSTYKGIHDAIIKEREKIKFGSSKGVWADNLIENIVPPMRTQVKGYKPFEKLLTLVKHNPYFQLQQSEEEYSIIHYMNKGAGINWHDDGKWKYGATFYVNHRWHKKWGGEFMFTDNNGHGWIPPVGNSVVIVKSPLVHKVNPVLSPTMPRISIQMFMK